MSRRGPGSRDCRVSPCCGVPGVHREIADRQLLLAGTDEFVMLAALTDKTAMARVLAGMIAVPALSSGVRPPGVLGRHPAARGGSGCGHRRLSPGNESFRRATVHLAGSSPNRHDPYPSGCTHRILRSLLHPTLSSTDASALRIRSPTRRSGSVEFVTRPGRFHLSLIDPTLNYANSALPHLSVTLGMPWLESWTPASATATGSMS